MLELELNFLQYVLFANDKISETLKAIFYLVFDSDLFYEAVFYKASV